MRPAFWKPLYMNTKHNYISFRIDDEMKEAAQQAYEYERSQLPIEERTKFRWSDFHRLVFNRQMKSILRKSKKEAIAA